MILCLDCGNTAIDLGFYDETGLLKSRYLFLSKETRSSDDFAMRLKLLVAQDNLSCNGAIISSVVPSLTKVLEDSIRKVFNVKVKVLNKDLKTRLPIKIDNPKELGTDFISTAVGALEKYKAPLVIADLGTTTKLSVIDKNGYFVGGIITAGMKVSLKGLVDNTTVYLSAFRTNKEYQGQGYFSKLFKYMINDLKEKGYKNATVGVEPCEVKNMQIYFKYGFDKFIKADYETYPDGTKTLVLYYAKDLN